MEEKLQDLMSRGVALMAAGNYENAKELFDQVIKENPKILEAYMSKGDACANLELYDEAIDCFKKALMVDSSFALAYFSIGSIYVLKEDNLKALQFFNKAAEAGYESAEMYLLMSTIFWNADDEIQAMRYLNRAIKLSPLDGSLRLSKVRMYLNANKFDMALEALDEMEAILPDAYEVYDLKAQIYMGMQKYSEAEAIISKGCTKFPEDANLAAIKLKVLVSIDKDEDAIQQLNLMKRKGLYELVIKDASLQEATLFLKKEKVEEATAVLVNANEKLGYDADIVYILMDIYGKTGKYEELLTWSDKMIANSNNDLYFVTALFFHATALKELARTEESQKEFKAITEKVRKMTIEDPGFYEGYLFRLLAHIDLSEFDEALDLADYVENLYPDRADAHAFRYQVYTKMGKLEDAEREKARAREIDPAFYI